MWGCGVCLERECGHGEERKCLVEQIVWMMMVMIPIDPGFAIESLLMSLLVRLLLVR